MAANISVLPEDVISHILSLTSPQDACRSSSVSSGFKSTANSDAVWERFLPPDYAEIIGRSESPVIYRTKKQLYFRLSDSYILLDGGKMCFRIDKYSGKKCYMLGARELSIAWKDDPRYWRWGPLTESRFSEVAQLHLVFWLDIQAKVETRILSPKASYAAYLVYKTTADSYGLGEAAKTTVKLVRDMESMPGNEDGVEAQARHAYLKIPRRGVVSRENRQLPRRRNDGWMEIELGEFCNEGDDGAEVFMQLKEVEDLNAKGGLIVEGIEVRPKLINA